MIDDVLRFMKIANELALECPPSASAYSVGAVIADEYGKELGRGFSRQTDVHNHAEEEALQDVKRNGYSAKGAYAYVSLEPCGIRKSKPQSCAGLFIEEGIKRVYFSRRETPLLVAAQTGLARLEAAGVECMLVSGFDGLFEEANKMLLKNHHKV